jgi:hypothetical protein
MPQAFENQLMNAKTSQSSYALCPVGDLSPADHWCFSIILGTSAGCILFAFDFIRKHYWAAGAAAIVILLLMITEGLFTLRRRQIAAVNVVLIFCLLLWVSGPINSIAGAAYLAFTAGILLWTFWLYNKLFVLDKIALAGICIVAVVMWFVEPRPTRRGFR